MESAGFVYAQFIACVLVGLAYVEQTLAALFYSGGKSIERARISDLLSEAATLGWIEKSDYEALDRVRKIRNALSHYRPPMDKETTEYRAVVSEKGPHSVIEDDAKHVVRAAFSLFSRRTAF